MPTCIVVKSIVLQGLRSSYRRHYWKYLFQLLKRWRRHQQKRWQGLIMLISGHHFIEYAADVVTELDEALQMPETKIAV